MPTTPDAYAQIAADASRRRRWLAALRIVRRVIGPRLFLERYIADQRRATLMLSRLSAPYGEAVRAGTESTAEWGSTLSRGSDAGKEPARPVARSRLTRETILLSGELWFPSQFVYHLFKTHWRDPRPSSMFRESATPPAIGASHEVR